MSSVQIDLFEKRDRDRIGESYLEASDSPNEAFYLIWIEGLDEGFIVRKESGALGRVRDKRDWWFENYAGAVKYKERLIKEKTNPERKSNRKYRTHIREKTVKLESKMWREKCQEMEKTMLF